jgi:hypothetical protein
MRLLLFTLSMGMATLLLGCASGPGASGLRDERAYSPHSLYPPSAQTTAASTASPAQRSATLTRHAVLATINDVVDSPGGLASSRLLLASTANSLGTRVNGVFSPYLLYGANQLRWLNGSLAGASRLANAAAEVDEPDMELALLRLAGPRLEAAMSGSLLLAAWLDFLTLAEAVLRQCPFYSVERLFVDMERVHKLIEPSMRALSSLEPAQVQAAAAAMPELMGQLSREFHSIRETARLATERGGQFMAAAQFVEMLTLASAMKLSLPRLPPAAPATLGVGLVMGSNGVLLGTRLVVSAEWVERIRRLVQAGVLSVPVVSAAVRIHAGQVLMSQANQDLPQGVRDALGEGPEVGGMRVTGRAGAGMAEPPQHHVMPKEHREWFEKRGFTGEMSIDQFCVELELAHHQAIHGGGNWRLGRMWAGEWNRMIMGALSDAEALAGRMLTRSEVLDIVAHHMRKNGIPMNFAPWRGR